MLRIISQLTRVVLPTQIWLKHQPECSLYSIAGCCGGSRNDLPRIITHQSKCSVFCLYKTAKREFQQSSKLAVITCSGTKEEKMAPTRVILMSCGSYNPPTNMHLRMFGTYMSFFIINMNSLRKHKVFRYIRSTIDKLYDICALLVI